MTDQPQALTLEIIPPEIQLEPAEKLSLTESFGPFFRQAQQMRDQAVGITEPAEARRARLAFRDLRNAAEKKRVDLKKNIVLMGKAIDGTNALLLTIITPIEKQMDDIEKAELRREEQRIADLHQSRYEQIEKFGVESFLRMDFGTMPEEEFTKLLTDAQEMQQLRLDREKREAEDKLRKEKEEADERERVRLENERLQREAEERKEELRKEREKAEADRKALEERARLEREEVERKQKLIDAENQRKLDAERALADAERVKREQAEKVLEDARKLREEEDRKRREEKEAAEKAPDKEKLIALANQLNAVTFPVMITEKGKLELGAVKVRFGQLEQWIRDKAKNL